MGPRNPLNKPLVRLLIPHMTRAKSYLVQTFEQEREKHNMHLRKKHQRRAIPYAAKKYYRWFRLYVRRVRTTEKEMGDTINPC